MGVEQIDYVYVETYNWGKAVKFWQNLGFTLTLDLGSSGKLQPPDGGPGIFLEEVPKTTTLAQHAYFRVAQEFDPESPVEVLSGWEDSHWGSRLLTVRDPDGRVFVLQRWTEGEP